MAFTEKRETIHCAQNYKVHACITLFIMSILTVGLCDCLNQEIFDKLRLKNCHKTTDFISKDPEEVAELTGVPYKVMFMLSRIVFGHIYSD